MIVMECIKPEKLMRNLTLMVFTKLENSRDDDGKNEFPIVL